MPDIKAVLFDTFGTVVNWRDSIIADFSSFGQRTGVFADWGAFLDEWKAAYRPGMDAVRGRARPWTRVEHLYREKLDELLPKYGLEHLTAQDRAYLNRVWHRLRPGSSATSSPTA